VSDTAVLNNSTSKALSKTLLTERELEVLPTDELLSLYKQTGEETYKWPLVLRYEGLIKSIALQICGVYNGFAQVDDIVNEGILTLMNSVDKFDPEKGAKFETYVSKRIRGMIIDLARQQDWLPRSVRRRAREIDQAVNSLNNHLGRFPTDEEIAGHMGLSVEKYREDAAAAALCNIVSLEALFERRSEGDTGVSIPAAEDLSPEDSVQQKELREMLGEGIRSLRKNEQMVLSLYYERGLNMRNIAQAMDISEPRVSQIHSRAIQKLRVYLGPYMGQKPERGEKRE